VTVRGPIRYAQSGDVSIAYQVTGDGPFDLVLVPGFVSHLEYDWEEPRHAAFLERLGSFARLIRLDKRGTGLSDRHGGIPDLETRMDDVRAVMDAAGSESAAVFGYFEGGPMSVLFAATYPERTSALVLFSTYARFWAPELTEEELQADLDERVIPHWGDGSTVAIFAPDADEVLRNWWGARERLAGSPGAARNLISASWITDVTEVLPAVQAPTLVVYRGTDPVLAPEQAHFLAQQIPDASLVEVPGDSTFPWLESGPLLDRVEEFLTGARGAPAGERVLATILFTDLVGSTEAVRRFGDDAWARLLERHHAAVRRELERLGGEEIDTAGDGFLATFDGPARAIRCALAIELAVRELGLEIRLGLHTGEVERRAGGAPRGIAVHVAARISSIAEAGQVLVSGTTRDLVAGSGLEFDDLGEFELKGLDERRPIYRARGV
jgi:class 3 adenylate cyclase